MPEKPINKGFLKVDKGLKIPRTEMSVPVRVRPSAPEIKVSTDLTSKSLPMIRSIKIFPSGVALLSLMLGACSTQSDNRDFAGRMLVAPDKFQNYSCEQLAIRANGAAGRRKQLEQLMAKAGTSPDGRMVSAMAYQVEYTEQGGDLDELRRAAAVRNCKPIAVLQAPNSRR